MYKLFFAIGNDGIEEFLIESKLFIESFLKTTVDFVGKTVYREGIISGIEFHSPDLIIIRDGLRGSHSLTDIIYEIKINHPNTRIIFIAGNRKVGDALLATLVQLGVYDLIIGGSIDATEIIRMIIEPNKLSDVAHLLPKISIDEQTNKQLFEAPDVLPIIKSEPTIKPIKGFSLKETKTKSLKNNKNVTPETTQYEDSLIMNINTESDNDAKLAPLADDILIDTNESELETDTNSSDDLILDIDDDCNTNSSDDLILDIDDDEIDLIDKEDTLNNEFLKTDVNYKKEDKHKEKIFKIIPIGYKKEKIEKDLSNITESIEKKDNPIILTNENLPNEIINKKEIEESIPKKGLVDMIFGGKKDLGRFNQQIITFMGGKSGVGNSQIAFNVALDLAKNGHKVIYIDLNDRFSTIDYTLQLGYTDVGLNTALSAFDDSNYNLINTSIVNIQKILQTVDKENFLYKTYLKMPTTLDFLFFSQQYMDRDINNSVDIPEINPDFIKDLNMYLFMTGGYEFIILDAPSDIRNKLTELSLIYSTKIFFTITQDVSVIGHHLKNIPVMNRKGINFKEKFYYLLNKNENALISSKDVYTLLSDYLKLDGFNIVTIPNLNKDIINSNYLGIPLLWNVKSKEFKTAFSQINSLILQ